LRLDVLAPIFISCPLSSFSSFPLCRRHDKVSFARGLFFFDESFLIRCLGSRLPTFLVFVPFAGNPLTVPRHFSAIRFRIYSGLFFPVLLTLPFHYAAAPSTHLPGCCRPFSSFLAFLPPPSSSTGKSYDDFSHIIISPPVVAVSGVPNKISTFPFFPPRSPYI